MYILVNVLALTAVLVLVKSEFPFESVYEELDYNDWPDGSRSDDLTSYRLPNDFDPIHADIEVTPYFETAPIGSEPFTFDGNATLELRAIRDGLTALILQENVRKIIEVTLTTSDGTLVPLNETHPFERIQQYQFLRINLRNGIVLNNDSIYYLYVSYIGNINETPLTRGMFRGSYKDDNGNIQWYAATHLQPTHARQLFPCFDEPGFKSTFNITVNRPAHFTETFSNMRIRDTFNISDRVKEMFYQTPRMSAYLITIHISGQFTVIADNNDDDRSYRIIGRPNAQGQGSYALQIGPALTKWFDEYLGVEYYTMADGMKNDQLASPDWASGATENWGLVSYRELRLLYQEGETNAADKMSIGTITAHELAHKWFGNYITARWWDNVWINEGFASYFEYFAMHAIDRTLELEDQFNLLYVQSALSADSSASTRALQHAVNSPAQVSGHFSGISYSKGASLLLMLKHFLSEPTFKRALHVFLVDRAYKYAIPEHLYRAFEVATSESGGVIGNINITSFMRYWVDEPGYPLLDVTVNRDTGVINLKQERFFLNPTTLQRKQIWPIPLTYTSGRSPNWNNLTPSFVMTSENERIQETPGHSWYIFNLQQKGIYRVNYDEHNWEMIADALRNNVSNIHHLNRAQIVDDVFALMRSGKMTFALGFKVLDFLKQDTSYYAWYPAITGLNWIRNRFLHMPAELKEFDELLFEFLQSVIGDVGYEVKTGEPLTTTLNRFYILSFACNIGHNGCVNDALEKFKNFKNGVSVNPNLRRHVFCEGLRRGNYEDWYFLYQRRQLSNNQADSSAMLRSLGCTTNDRAVKEYLEMVLSNDVKAQDRVNAFTFLYMGNRANARIALQFIKQRADDIRRAVILPAWFNNVLSAMASYLDEEGLTDMETWLRSNQGTIPEYNVGLNAIASTRANMKWGTERAGEILTAVRGAAPVFIPTTTLIITALVAMMIK